MADPTLADVLSAVEALRDDIAGIGEMEANTAPILSDLSKQIAPMQQRLAAIRDDIGVNFGTARIASPEMLPGSDPLPHLICSPPMFSGGGRNEADQHGNA